MILLVTQEMLGEQIMALVLGVLHCHSAQTQHKKEQ